MPAFRPPLTAWGPLPVADPGDRLQLLGEALDGFAYEWDLRTDAVSRSAGLLALLGFAPEDVPAGAEWWQARIHPDDLPAVRASGAAAFADVAATRVLAEYRVRHRDGSWRWLRDHARLVRDADGRVVRLVGLAVHTTAEREALAREAAARAAADTATRQLRTLLDRVSDGFVAVDRTWRITHVNAAAARTNGTTPEALVGRDAWDVWGPARGTRFERELRAAMADGRPRTFAEAYRQPDGSLLWVEDRVYPAPEGLTVFFRDVTEERLAQEALAATERRYARLAESNVVGMLFWDVHGPVLEANDRFLAIVGYTRDDLAGGRIDWRTLTPPEYAAVDAGKLAELRARGMHEPYAKEYVRKDGTRVPVLVGAAFFEGSQERGVSIILDQSEPEAARQRVAFLAAASERLADAPDVDAALVAVAELAVPALANWAFVEGPGMDGVVRPLAVTHEDPAQVRLAHEVLERWPIDPAAPHGTGRVLRTGEPELVPVIDDAMLAAVAQDAEHLAVLRTVGFRSSLAVPLRAGEGPPIAVLTLVSTAPGRQYGAADLALAEEVARRAEAALRQARLLEAERAARAQASEANRAKAQFLATMSHELRTPLNAISGYAELLALGIHGPVTDEQRAALARIQRSQQHLLGLINEVLNYARVEAGVVHYDVRAVPVAEVLEAVEALVVPQVRARALRLVLAPGTPGLAVRADAEKLGQVLLNLLSNAIKFTAAGGTVTVSSQVLPGADGTTGERVALAVTDTGIGIAADQLERVFEPFVQVGRTLRNPGEGTGLGLAISRDLARGMGGDLVAESVPGVGSTFTLVLPRDGGDAADGPGE